MDTGGKKSATILIADREPFIRDTLKIKLLGLGYNVITAETGKELTKLALNQKPELILTDTAFEDTDTFKVCQVLKGDARTSAIPIVVLSREANLPEKQFSYGPYIKEWIMKPFSPREVAGIIKGILSAS